MLVALVVIALAAPRYGADSRWARRGSPYRHTPLGDLRAAGQWVRSHTPRTKTVIGCPPSSRCSAL